MPKRTTIFAQVPWDAGINSSKDPALIGPNYLVTANNVIFDTRGSRQKREGVAHFDDGATTSGTKIVGLFEWWHEVSGVKTLRIVGVTTSASATQIVVYSPTGIRAAPAATGGPGALDVNETQVSFETVNNSCIIGFSSSSTTPKKVYWSGSQYEYADLGGTPPNFSICRTHLGRLWTNEKTRLDRIHYSETGTAEIWGGTGDSGAFDIRIGDGDANGLSAIFPTFKGDLFIAKRTKLYRIVGLWPEDMEVRDVSRALGCVSNASIIQVDQDDMLFCSDRGFHSLATTVNFGDFESKYLSADIQPTFNTFLKSQLSRIQGVYIPQLNSVVWAITESNKSVQNDLWFYNFTPKMDGSGPIGWYRWPDISCTAIATALINNAKVLLLGTENNRVLEAQQGNYTDVYDSVNTVIRFKVKSGYITPDNSLHTLKAFKKLIVYHRPKGDYPITATVKIDNYSEQMLTVEADILGDLLGTTFRLGTSSLASAPVLAPYSYPIEGVGRGFTVQFEQGGLEQQVEIYGFGVEWEPAGDMQETI